MEKLLQVTRIEKNHSDKINCDFNTISFVGIKFFQGREVKTMVGGVRNLWPEHKVTLKDGTGEAVIKADKHYGTALVGDLFEGEVQSFDTTPYQLPGSSKMITRWSGVIFANENGLAVAAKNLRQYNAAPIDPESGLPFVLGAQAATKKLAGIDAEP